MRNKGRQRISKHEDGGLMAAADADDIDAEPLATVVEGMVERDNAEGKGKHQKTANRLYRLSDFTRHWDNEGSDVE